MDAFGLMDDNLVNSAKRKQYDENDREMMETPKNIVVNCKHAENNISWKQFKAMNK